MATLSSIITPSNLLTDSNTATVTNKTINGSNNTLTNISLSTGVTGTLPIANGGTGTTSTQFVNLTTNVTGDLPFSNLAQGSALSVLGVVGNSVADVASIVASSDYQVLRRSGASIGFGSINIAQSGAITGTLAVNNGGTGSTTFTANNVLLGNGSSSFQTVAPGTSGNILTSDGTTWTSAASTGVTTGKSIAMAMIFGF